MAKKILITGASGLIGHRLTELLLEKGYGVVHLSRAKKPGRVETFAWNLEKRIIDVQALAGVDTIIHLAGAGIADKPWTVARKKEIIDSRVESTKLLFQTLKNNPHTVSSFISASAIGYYGTEDSERVFSENDSPGQDFLAEVTQRWEQEVDTINELGVRVTKFRIGIVLSEKGGALNEIVKPIRMGFGAALGSGRQYLSWIHLDDLCNLFLRAVEERAMSGHYNAVTDFCTNKEFTQACARVLRKPIWLPPVPSMVLKIILGDRADLVLKGSKVSSAKIRQAGFHFQYETLESALRDLLG
ncbi:MAG: TIGR01777 family oxidoreductase [Bacteroidetes bacterium]|nr:TIGR01777 family oxidoreductase [Bacteroidota bacterium]